MKEILALVAIILLFVAYVPYIRDVLSTKTKPHVYSWFVWGLLGVLTAGLQIKEGAGPGGLITLVSGLISFFVFALGLKNGRRDITLSDTILFTLALIATGIWFFAEQPLSSMLLLVSAGVLGSIPTFRKSWHKPTEETLSFWRLNGIRHILSIGALATYNAVTLLNPVTWVIINSAMTLLLILRRHQLQIT